MKKVIVINPRGIKGDQEYLHGFMSALNKQTDIDVTLYTNYYYEISEQDITYNCKRLFFKNSEYMKNKHLRKIVRLLEYIIDYIYLIRIVKRQKPDIVHIHWSVISQLDGLLFNALKKNTRKLIFTAHNVLPHVNGENFINSYKKIYNLSDCIIVHGESIYEEFTKYYPDLSKKVYISKHGKKTEKTQHIDFSDHDVIKIEKQIGKFEKVFLCFGMIYYEKGMDRVINIWKEISHDDSTCLIVAGKPQPMYDELSTAIDSLRNDPSFIFINSFLSNNVLNYLLSKSSLIILPYRHASMSGVMLTAAARSIPVLCTNVGSLSEYTNNNCGWIIDNNDKDLLRTLNFISNNVTLHDLKRMGIYFHDYVDKEFGWNHIIDEMVKNCY